MAINKSDFASELGKGMEAYALEKKAQQRALEHPGFLFKSRIGRYIASVDGNLFYACRLASDDTEMETVDGIGRWWLNGEQPDGVRYNWRFKTFRECREIITGMRYEFENGGFEAPEAEPSFDG